MSEPYGPFKPAYMTVPYMKLDAFLIRESNRLHDEGHDYSVELPVHAACRLHRIVTYHEIGSTFIGTTSERCKNGKMRVTFFNDTAAAEFALRYA